VKKLAVILLVAACGRTAPPMVTAADAQRANIELAELQQGRKLLVGKCANCHRTPMPTDHSAAEWPLKLAEMAQRANIDTSQRVLIEKYLVVMAQR
jgi:cytochrome c5